jgi:redox-sensing transcriptional repressor
MPLHKNSIVRLCQYKNTLYRFKALGVTRIFSDLLAQAIGHTSATVRKDFSFFGISGNKRGGYEIEVLIARLNEILHKNKLQRVVLAGAGNLGSALLRYKNFEKEGMKIVAAFDVDPAKIARKTGVPVMPVDALISYVKDHGIRIGIIAVPEHIAQTILDLMISAGIQGVLNFAPIQLKASGRCIVNNVNLELELENLIYFVNNAGGES